MKTLLIGLLSFGSVTAFSKTLDCSFLVNEKLIQKSVEIKAHEVTITLREPELQKKQTLSVVANEDMITIMGAEKKVFWKFEGYKMVKFEKESEGYLPLGNPWTTKELQVDCKIND